MSEKDAAIAFEKICVNALARREHSRRELAGKAPQDLPADLVNAVLDTLAEKGWQDDTRYCESFVRSKVQKGDGALKIRQALRQRGIADNLIQDTLDTVDWFAVAEGVYAKKYRGEPVKNQNERMKRQRFMAQRGFSFEEINAVLS